jgi:hypothetical protein
MLNNPTGPLPTQGPAPSAVDTAVRAFAEILVHGAREYFKSPRFEELIGIVSQPPQPIQPPSRPPTADPPPLNYRGCPWCEAARALAGIRADLVHAAESKYHADFIGQASVAARELTDRVGVTWGDFSSLMADFQSVVSRIRAAHESMMGLVTAPQTQQLPPNPFVALTEDVERERMAIIQELDRLIAHCHAKSEEPVQHTPPPPGAANGQQRR